MNKKVNITVAITAIIIIAGILAGIAYFINKNQATNNSIKKQIATPIVTSSENNSQNSDIPSMNNKCSADNGSPELMLCKLAKALRAENDEAIISYFNPYSKKTANFKNDLKTMAQSSKDKLADSFEGCISKERNPDYIIYECPWTTKDEKNLILEMRTAKDQDGKWVVVSW